MFTNMLVQDGGAERRCRMLSDDHNYAFTQVSPPGERVETTKPEFPQDVVIKLQQSMQAS